MTEGRLWDLLSIPAQMDPSREILRYEGRSWTYEGLMAASARFEPALLHATSIMDVNTDLTVALVYASFLAGSELALLNFRLRVEEVEKIFERHATGAFLAGVRYEDIARRVARDRLASSVGLLDTARFGIDTLAEAETPAMREETTVKSVADVVLFTSGTSSSPKPVVIGGTSLVAYVAGTTPLPSAETANQATLLTMPLFHVAGLVGLLRSVFMGRRVVIHPQFEAETWLAGVEEEEITHTFVVPTMLRRILDSKGYSQSRVASLEVLSYGGGPMPPSLIEEALDRFPGSVRFVGTYGLTEAGGTVCVLSPEDHDDARHGEAALSRLHSVGLPVHGIRVAILGGDRNELEPGDVGEVYVAGARLPPADECVSGLGRRWVRTGDLGHLDRDGYLHLHGRVDDVIIRGGENISPLEIERVVLAHPTVRQVAVVGTPDETWGERIVAFLVVREPISSAVLVDHCRERLATFKVPDAFHFADRLPMTSTGKVMKHRLRHRLSKG